MFYYFLVNVHITDAYRLCVVGAGSGLGRELIYQGLNCDQVTFIQGLTNSPQNVYVPFRNGSLEDQYMKNDALKRPLFSKKLELCPYNSFECSSFVTKRPSIIFNSDSTEISLDDQQHFDAFVFCTSATAFQTDISDQIMESVLSSVNIDTDTSKIAFISAFGTKEFTTNLGIIGMRNWYLKSVYEKKITQEEILTRIPFKNKETQLKIFRPRVLTYGNYNLNSFSKSREDLASEILSFFALS